VSGKHTSWLAAVCFAFAGTAAAAGTFRDCAECPQMAIVPAGTFEMGSTPEDLVAAGVDVAANGDESPRHGVRFGKPFALGAYEVTRGEFARFVADTGYEAQPDCQIVRNEEWQVVPGTSWRAPGFPQGDSDPVVCVSWADATRYVEWLRRKSGKPFRLPSEAEWEYVARNGSASRKLGPTYANYGENDGWPHTAPVGSFAPDALGLHDVLGNVWEWLEDCYHGSYDAAPADGRARVDGCTGKRVVRGGSYGDPANLLRVGYRLRGPQDGRYATLGFRLARDLDEVTGK
jgi:formylglycine-generating enzyme required for sulfatase activity